MNTGSRIPAILALMLLVAAVATMFAVYRLAPFAWTVDVGGPFTDPLVPTGFYADEAAGADRYRWSQGHAEVTFADVGADTPLVVRWRLGTRPPEAPAPVPFTVTVGSQVAGTFTQGADATIYTATVATRPPGDPNVVMAFDAPTFRPAGGDTRNLGLKVEKVRIESAPGAPLPDPPPAVLLWASIITLGVYGVLRRISRRAYIAAFLALLGLEGLAVLLIVYRPLVTPWLPDLGYVLGALGLLALAWPWLRRWPAWLDSLADPRTVWAPLVLGLIFVGCAAFALGVLPNVAWIGHADYADNAVVARNLVDGRGFVVDYAAQFYRFYPGITHPTDTWPLLQPLLIAPFFWLLGTATWVAKLPNLFLLLILATAVYRFAGRWWDRRVGLLAAVLVLLHPYFFQTVLYPINDLAFTLLAFLAIGWAFDAVDSGQRAGGSDEETGIEDEDPGLGVEGARARSGTSVSARTTDHGPRTTQRPALSTQHSALSTRYAVLAGVAAGLLVWSKGASALLVLAGLGAGLGLALVTTRWGGRRPARDWRHLRWTVGAALLVLAPLLIRNWLTFGAPFYSTEQYDIWILRLYTGGNDVWERIYANYLAGGQPLPDRALLLRSYDALWNAVLWGFGSLWRGGVLNGDILDLPVVLAGAAGWLLAPWRLRPLRYAWVGAFAASGLFVLLAWHYEARYFLGLVPWFYLGTAAFLFWVWDHLRGNTAETLANKITPTRPLTEPAVRNPGRPLGPAIRNSPAALAFLPLAVAALLWPSVADIIGRAESDTGPDNFAAAGDWIAAHLPADAVVMTRNPWEFNWYAQRKAVMIPEGSLSDVQALAQRYGAGYLWVGGRGDSASLRPQLAPLYRGQLLPGLPATLLYQENGIYIYRLDR